MQWSHCHAEISLGNATVESTSLLVDTMQKATEKKNLRFTVDADSKMLEAVQSLQTEQRRNEQGRLWRSDGFCKWSSASYWLKTYDFSFVNKLTNQKQCYISRSSLPIIHCKGAREHTNSGLSAKSESLQQNGFFRALFLAKTDIKTYRNSEVYYWTGWCVKRAICGSEIYRKTSERKKL